ncbi:MAG: RNA polymerase sigma factor [Janthinobacterium lividum]
MPVFPANSQVLHPVRTVAAARTDERTASLQAEVLALFDELRDRLLRYSMSFGLSVQDGEDVLQEVFLALFRHLQMDRSRDNLPGWTYRTTHNLSLKRRAALHVELRRQDSVSHVGNLDICGVVDPLHACADDAPGPEEQLLFRERQLRLRAVLRVLPENDQICLQLRADGCRYREIASLVGISLGSVASSLARSFERLRRTDAR